MSDVFAVLTPEFEYLPGLFLPDRWRQRLLASELGATLEVVEGESAPEAAARLVARHESFGVMHEPFALRAGELLCTALREAGARGDVCTLSVPKELFESFPELPPPGPEVLVLERTPPSTEEFVERGRELARRVGPESIRLSLLEERAHYPRSRLSLWAHRCAIPYSAWRVAIEALLREVLPWHLPMWNAAVLQWELDASPLEECWAGNALAARNDELLSVILP